MELRKKADHIANSFYQKLEQRINAVSDGVLLFSLSAFYFLWRILMLPAFEFGGDAAFKWRFLRYFHETGIWFPLKPEHHQGRWAQNIPVSWLMECFDSSALWLGAVFPVIYGFITILLIWFITRKLGSKISAVSAVLCTMLYTVFYQESAQFLPSLPCTMYTLLALYLLVLYIEKPGRLFLPLLAGIVMGLAWGCKVTACYWCVGFALFFMFFPVPGKTLLRMGKIRIGWDVILFSLGFLAVFIPETIFINDFFHVTQGRISMLGGHVDARLAHETAPLFYNFIQYLFSPFMFFLDFSGKAIYQVPFCLLFLLAVPPLFLQLRDKTVPLPQKFLAFSLLIAALLHSYMVVKVFPFQHPERSLPRYFLTLSCCAVILLFTARRHLPELKENLRFPVLCLYRGIFLVLLVFMVCGWLNDPVRNGDHLFNKIEAYRCIRIQKERNLPLLILYNRPQEYDSRTFKVTMLWKSFLADLPELRGILSKEPDLLQQEWGSREPVTDSSGEKYFLLLGTRPAPGAAAECIVVNEAKVRCKVIQIAGRSRKNQ